MLSSLGGGILEKSLLSPFHHLNPNSNHTNLKFASPSLSHPLLHQSLNSKKKNCRNRHNSFIFCCSTNDSTTTSNDSTTTTTTISVPPLVKKRKRYRKLYPGESQGIVEEMRFVAMKLRNHKTSNKNDTEGIEESELQQSSLNNSCSDSDSGSDEETWQPNIEGFIKYLVDSKLVFTTLERIVDESKDVAYAYFRKTGLERSEMLSKDLEWFRQQDLVIPEPSNPGVSYARYLEELADKSAPMFLCHFYNIYFAHISGGQVITKQVSENLLEGKKLEFCRWEGHELELLKDARDKLNKLGEHWSRDNKNKCLREAAKSFRFLGQIIRLIIL